MVRVRLRVVVGRRAVFSWRDGDCGGGGAGGVVGGRDGVRCAYPRVDSREGGRQRGVVDSFHGQQGFGVLRASKGRRGVLVLLLGWWLPLLLLPFEEEELEVFGDSFSLCGGGCCEGRGAAA